MKHRIAVHKGCTNKGDPKNVTDGWLNVEEDLSWLFGWVQAGYPWCATHFVDRYRCADSANGSSLIAVDIDGDCTLNQFWETGTAKAWCAATYTSCSHTPEQHRFRAIFPLAVRLENSLLHETVYFVIVKRLLVELGLEKLKDNSGKKPERLWFGNTRTVVRENPGAEVPDFILSDIEVTEPQLNHTPSDVDPEDIERVRHLLEHVLRPSEDGEYDYFQEVICACKGTGDEVFDSFQDWLARGHHGTDSRQADNNRSIEKWNSFTGSGPAKLYKIANLQQPGWKKGLANHLRWGANGNAVGYKEHDELPCFDELKGDKMELNDPQPDFSTVKVKAGRPKKAASDSAKERAADVNQVKDILLNLRKNTLTQQIEYDDSTGKTVVVEGDDLNLMTTRLCYEHGVFIPEQRCKVAVGYAANCNSYCPIRQYLNHCSKQIPHPDWDRIGEVFLGSPHKIATQALQRMMIGAVARGYKPGCTMSWLPILVGAQGVGKSMFARNLVPPELFAEITSPLESLHKEPYRLHTSGWLLELPEIDNFFSVKNIENFKNLITTRVDEVRMPYETPKKMARKFVLIGTTNRNQFLLDSTGNRRFVPLEIARGFQIPWRLLAQERDELWAAAIAAYKAGVGYEFTSGEIAAVADYIQEFGEPDPWTEKITSYIAQRSEVQVAQVLTNALDLDPRNQGRREARRVADVLQAMNWRRLVTSRKDESGRSKSVRVWQRPLSDPLNEDHILNDF